MIRGAYQFFEPGEDPSVQADILIGKVGKLGDGDLPATLDVEVTGGQSAATIAANVKTWTDKVEAATGRKPMIYTGPYFWEDNVGSSAFAANPLWVADYGPSCPLLPSPWTAYRFWQYSDGGGNLDLDVFDGSLAELQAFARPPNAPPKGYLDSADCKAIAGWAQDDDVPTQALAVHVYFDGPAGAAAAFGVPTTAGNDRPDLCKPLGSCNHGYSLATPRGLMDGKAHQVYAYGIDEAGGANTLLTGAPKSFTCAPPPPPAPAVKRWIPSPKVLAAWKLSTLDDLAHYDDATVSAIPQGADLEASPTVVIADDGSPAVWVVDGAQRRHVRDPASMTAWRFGAPAKWTAAKVNALPQGRDWPEAPFLAQGAGAPVYVLDTPEPESETDGGVRLPTPGAPQGAGASSGAPASAGDVGDGGGAGASGGCSAAGETAPRGAPWAAIGLAAAATALRRRSARARKGQVS